MTGIVRLSAIILLGALLTGLCGCDPSPSPPSRALLAHANALRADDWPARVIAVERCAADPTPHAVRVFCAAGHDTDDRVRLRWDRAVDRLADRSGVDWLLRDGLTHSDRAVRYAAWRRWLVPAPPAVAVEQAAPYLAENFEEIQMLALDRLGASRDPITIKAACVLLRPGHAPHVRLKAVALLRSLRDPYLMHAGLTAVIEEAVAPVRDASPGVGEPLPSLPIPNWAFERAVEELAEGVTDPPTISYLTGCLQQAGAPARTPYASVTSAKQGEMAVRLLARSGQSEGALVLLALARDAASPALRREAIAALAEVDHPIREERLVDLLRTEKDVEMRLALASTWHAIQNRSAEGERAIGELRSREEDWRVRMALHVPRRFPVELPFRAAVQAAISWLCRTQEFDGRWEAIRWNPHPPDREFSIPGGAPAVWDPALRDDLNATVTSLALLALIGAREHGAPDDPPYHASMRCAARWLISEYVGGSWPGTGLAKRTALRRRAKALTRWAICEWLAYEVSRAADRSVPLCDRMDVHDWYPTNLCALLWSSMHLPPVTDGVPTSGPYLDLEEMILDVAAARACGFTPLVTEDADDGGFPSLIDDLSEAPVEWRRTLHEIGVVLRKGRDLEGPIGKVAARQLASCSARAQHGVVPSNSLPTFWYSGLGSSARAIVLSRWLGAPLGTRGDAEAAKWLGPTASPDIATLAHLSFHRPVWEAYFEIIGSQSSVPDPLWPFPRSEEFAKEGVLLFPSWEDDIVDLDYWFWGALAADGARDEAWAKDWRASLERVLVAEQRRAGAERGSWDPEGPWERVTGRVGATALGAMALEAPDRRWAIQK